MLIHYSIYRKKWLVSRCIKYVKIRWFCVEKVRIEALSGKIFNFNEITKITECTRVPVSRTWNFGTLIAGLHRAIKYPKSKLTSTEVSKIFIRGGTSEILGGTYKIRLRAVSGPGGGSSWNLAFCGPTNVLQRLQNIKCFWTKNPINLSSDFTKSEDHA
jgi:hypothetical protein